MKGREGRGKERERKGKGKGSERKGKEEKKEGKKEGKEEGKGKGKGKRKERKGKDGIGETIINFPEVPTYSFPIPISFLPSKVTPFLNFLIITTSLFLILLLPNYLPLECRGDAYF